jgi:ZIP family zinc transporter
MVTSAGYGYPAGAEAYIKTEFALMAIGISIHNIPEGLAVGAGVMHMPEFGLFIALAIALHNIPEGIATALPLCEGGMCGWKSFRIALLSGLVEPVGALIAATFLAPFQSLIPAALAFCRRRHGIYHAGRTGANG